MFVATNRLRIKQGYGEQLEEGFRHQGGVERQPGFLGFELWRLNKEEEYEEYLVVTHWESKDAHDQWTHSEAFRAAHSGPRLDFFTGHPEFSTYDVRLASRPDETKVSI